MHHTMTGLARQGDLTERTIGATGIATTSIVSDTKIRKTTRCDSQGRTSTGIGDRLLALEQHVLYGQAFSLHLLDGND